MFYKIEPCSSWVKLEKISLTSYNDHGYNVQSAYLLKLHNSLRLQWISAGSRHVH